MQKKDKLIYPLIILLMMISCRKEIKYNGELEEERLVVNMITENNYPFQLS